MINRKDFSKIYTDKSGFFDLDNVSQCKHPEHDPPSHIHIPEGKGYRHICPACGKVSTLIPPHITFNVKKLRL